MTVARNAILPTSGIGNVADHLGAGHGGAEVAVHQVRDRPGWPCCVVEGRHGRGWQAPGPARASRRGPAPGRPARPAGQLRQIRRYPYVPSESSKAFWIRSLSSSLRFAVRCPAGTAIRNTLTSILQPGAHARDCRSGRPGGVLRIDELIHVAHRCSAAKYAAAFERKSAFIRSSRFSRSAPATAPARTTATAALLRVILAVVPHPVAQRGLVNPELAGTSRSAVTFPRPSWLLPRGTRSEFPVFPCHLIPSFPVKIL